MYSLTHHLLTEVVQKVNEMIATGQYGRLFAVVHFASKQWKVTSEDLILMENVLPAECGDRIRLEKVLLVGADDFTLIGKPLLGLCAPGSQSGASLSPSAAAAEHGAGSALSPFPGGSMSFSRPLRRSHALHLAVRSGIHPCSAQRSGSSHASLFPTEMIYRHTAVIDGEMVHFEILDTAGQEEDSLQIEEKIKWGDGFAVVYSVTDRCSFDEVMRLCFLINHIHSSPKRSGGGGRPPPGTVGGLASRPW
ncbi:39S ribosomal protein L21 [Chelonia mydas]|uniref:Large ribosomal subunit protein bL21m n=1 Tax=Chelonia mydas TaxID=8469 RepID=M7CD08_CHEMY|nr:39S ribosomal protein L21 [Chelonia mydas]